MKKICNKIVSILVLAAMLVSVLPVMSFAVESTSATLVDAVFVRSSSPDTLRGGGLLQINSGSDRRISLLKFDFSGYADKVDRIANMLLTVYYKEASTGSGMKVYIMPDDKESWNSEKYNYTTAHKTDNIVTASCGTLIYQTSETMVKDQAIVTTDLSQAVREHLKNNPSNTIVTFKLDGINDGAYVLYGIGQNAKSPSLTFDVITDAEYVSGLVNDVVIPEATDFDIALDEIAFPDDVNVSWTSSNANLVSNSGTVKIPGEDTNVTLTLKVSLKSDESVYATKDFGVNILAGGGSETVYLWDFEGENGLVDKINGGTFATSHAAHAVPELYADGSNTVAKVTWLSEDSAFVANTKPMLGASSPVFAENSDYRYIVASLDFKKDKSEKSFTFNFRDTANKGIISWGASACNWIDMAYVADLKKNEDGTRNFYAYYKQNGAYALQASKQYAFSYMDEFRITCNNETTSPNFYVDDLTIKIYKDFYAAVNRAADGKAVMNIIDSYAALNLAQIPAEYYEVSKYEKSVAASSLVGKNFTSDAEAFAALTKAIPEHFGAKIYYDWDFENGNLEDKMNGVEFLTGHPSFVEGSVVYSTDPADASNGVAKNIVGLDDNLERLVFTDNLKADFNAGKVKNVVFDLNLKAEGEGTTRMTIGSSSLRRDITPYVVNTNGNWRSFRTVADVDDGTITMYQYYNNMWNQVSKIESIEAFDLGRISHMNNTLAKTSDVYFDDIVIRAYDAIYKEVNEVSEENFETLMSQLEADKLITVPSSFYSISDEERALVISKVKSKVYTSDAEFEAALKAALPETNEIVYYNWDFENGTLNDTIKAEPFMMDHPGDTAENKVVIAADPTDASNSVAKIDYSASTLERLVFSPDINADFANSLFGYVTYDFRVYTPETTNVALRISSVPTNHHLYANDLEGGKWHTVRAIVDLDNKLAKGYELIDGEWTLIYYKNNISAFDFNRFSIFLEALEKDQVPVAYFDDFKVSSHVSLCEKVNAATEEDVTDILEYYDSICAIDLTDSYDEFTADEKAEFASHIKSKTYADSYEVNKEVVLYFTDKDFVVLGDVRTDSKLDWIKLIIAKNDITAESANVVVASYNGNALVDVKNAIHTGSLASGSDIEISNIGLDITNATSVKVMILSDYEKLTPLTSSEFVR